MTVAAAGPSFRARRIARGVGAAAVAVVFAAPLAIMVVASLREPALGPPRGVEIIPRGAGLEAYRTAFDLVPLLRALGNSLIVAAFAVPLTVLTASWAGLAIVLLRGARRTALVASALLLLMVPVTALWLTRFALFKMLGVIDTFIPLIEPALMGGSPFFVLLFALAFRRIPADVLDAARLEGAGPLRLWRRIAMPLVRPTTMAVALLAFALFWSNFLDPLLYITSASRQTAPLVLRSLELLGPTNWPVLLAGSVVVAAPAVLAFALAQRRVFSEERGAGWLGR